MAQQTMAFESGDVFIVRTKSGYIYTYKVTKNGGVELVGDDQ